MVNLISSSIDRILDEEIEDLEVFMSHRLRREKAEKHNLRYEDMDKQDIEDYFSQMEEKWNS